MQNNNTRAANSAVRNSIVASLQRVYPKALSYSDLFAIALNGTAASSKLNKQGGTYMRTLVKQGLAKQITTGYYCYIPQ